MLRSTAQRIALASAAIAAIASTGLAPITPSAHAADAPPPTSPLSPTDPTARAEWLSGQAEVAFSEKRYADAIRLYLDAWEASPAASMLYNVAFIYDKRLSDPELAIDYYERAANAPDADGEFIAKCKARVATLRAELAHKPPDDPPVLPPEKPKVPDNDSSFGPWVVTASGGALLLGGVVMGFVASGTQSDFEVADNASEKRELQDQGRTEALVADILMGTGVAAIGVGVIWMIIDSGSDEGTTSVTPLPSDSRFRLEPRLIPGGAALVLGGSL